MKVNNVLVLEVTDGTLDGGVVMAHTLRTNERLSKFLCLCQGCLKVLSTLSI
jgi:hypothetical protein